MSKPTEYQCMLDLETMGTGYNAAICSIGAVKFSLDKGIVDEFYCTINAKDCVANGLVVEEATVNWWLKQPREVMAALTKDTKSLKDGLALFSKWFGTKSLDTWGNGATFDNVIIQSAYEAVGIRRPWKYWNDRCFRTIKNIIVVDEETREGTYHNALDDAKHQAKHLLRIFGS